MVEKERKLQLTGILGWTATVLFIVCFIPQILKTLKTKTIDGLSFRLLLITFIANIIAFAYATRIKQPPLQVKYALSVFFVSACLYLYLRVFFSRNKSAKDEGKSDQCCEEG